MTVLLSYKADVEKDRLFKVWLKSAVVLLQGMISFAIKLTKQWLVYFTMI